MNITKTTNKKAKEPIRCSYCNEIIEAGKRHKEITYTINVKGKVVPCKAYCHISCDKAADKLRMYELPKITSHSFIKNVRAYILELYVRENKRMTKNEIDTKPISTLIDIIVKYHDELEAEAKPEISKGVMKEYLALCSTLFMIPNIVDDLIDALKMDGLYNKSAKRFVNDTLKDFERMTDALWNIYDNNTKDTMCRAGLDAYENIENSIALVGVERYANILSAVLAEVEKKYTKIGTELNIKDSLAHIHQLAKRMDKTINYTHQQFVSFVVSRECNCEGITLN